MSKAKKYDRSELLAKAVDLFHRKGFNGTSTAELVEELGVNRKSMYSEFGSKQKLFESAMDYYNENQLTWLLSSLESPSAGMNEIKTAFHSYASAGEGAYRGLGCLMCNTSIERGSLDPESGRYVSEYLERLTQAFRNVLSNAQKNDEIGKSVDIDEMSEFFTTTLLGVATSIRAEAPPAQLWSVYNVVVRVVDTLSSTHK